jgi:hypothetical protein
MSGRTISNFQDSRSDNRPVPRMAPNGTIYTDNQRQKMADEMGVCLNCGVRVKEKKFRLFATPLTNGDVYQGICIQCNRSSVPRTVYQEWQRRNRPAPVTSSTDGGMHRFRNAAQVALAVSTGFNHEVRVEGGISHQPNHPQQQTTPPNNSATEIAGVGRAPSNISLLSSQSPLTTSSCSLHSHQSVSSDARDDNQLSRPNIDVTVPLSLPPVDYKTKNLNVDPLALMRDLNTYRDRPEILCEKLNDLRNLSDNPAAALYEIRSIIERYGRDDVNPLYCRCTMLAVGALWRICSGDDAKKHEATETGCLDWLLDQLAHSREDPEMLHYILGALASLALLDSNRFLIARKGGLDRMVATLKRHGNIPIVFEWTCRLLYIMITPSDGSNHVSLKNAEKNMITIEENDGISVLLSVMNQHCGTDTVATTWAMKVLVRLQGHSNDAFVQKRSRLMLESGLADVCTNVLKATSTTSDLFVSTSKALATLLALHPNSVRITNAVSPVMRFVCDSNATAEVIASGSILLGMMLNQDDEGKSEMCRGRCLQPIIAATSQDLDNLDLVRSTLFLLCSLSSNSPPLDHSLLGDVSVFMQAVDAIHPDESDFNIFICHYVCNMAPVADQYPQNLPLGVLGRLCGDDRPSSDPHIRRAFALLSLKFPEYLDGRVGTNDQTEVARLIDGLSDNEVNVQSSSCTALSVMVAASEYSRNKVFEEGGLTAALATLMVTESEALGANALELMSALVCSDTKKVIQLPKEIIAGMLIAIERHPSLTKSACNTMRNCILVAPPGFTLNYVGIVDALCSLIDAPSTPEGTLIEACGVVWAYCVKEPVPKRDLTMLFSSLLGICVRKKGDEISRINSSVLTETAGALSAVMYKLKDAPNEISGADVDQVVAFFDSVIEFDVDNQVLLVRLMDAVMSMCFLCQELLVQFGVIVIVIDCMLEHENNEEIQQLGCAILSLLASTENLQVILSILETEGGIDLIVSALACFPDNSQIQTDACRALSHLSVDQECRMSIRSQGGLSLLVNAMKAFPEDTDLLEAAGSSLFHLSSDAEDQRLWGSHVVKTIVLTLQSQVQSVRVQEKCLGVLQNISMRSRDAKQMVSQSGGLEAVLFTMRKFMGSPIVMERALAILLSLGALEENQDMIAELDGFILIINVMLAHITYEKIQLLGCECLLTMPTTCRSKKIVRDAGGIEAIVYAMWAHYSSEGVLTEACRSLSSLAVNAQTNEVLIASEGEITAILGAMRRFPNTERLQEHGCVVLRNFLLSDDNLPLILTQQEQVAKLMNDALATFPRRCGDRARQVLQSIGA